jgi:GAF domain-containing protein
MTDTEARLRKLIQVATQLTSTHNLDDLLHAVIAATADLLCAEDGSILLLDEGTGELVFKVASGSPELAGTRMAAHEGIAGAALASGEPLVIADAAADPRFYAGIDQAIGHRTRNVVAIPLILRGRPLGVLEAINRPVGDLAGDDLEVAKALASLATVAIDNATMYANLADAVVAARLSYRL